MFSLANKAKPICHHQHQSKPLFHRIATLLLVIGTIRMILRPRPQTIEPASQSNQRRTPLISLQSRLAKLGGVVQTGWIHS
jgi:hypothetical protein